MALWGTKDSIFSPGTVTVDYANKTITGSGTSFTNASAGSVITIGIGGTYGEAVISGITSDTVISIATTQYLSGAAISGIGYTISQKPVYTLEDSNYSRSSTSSSNYIMGADIGEVEANATTEYALTHAGWVGIKTYVDAGGNLRVKSETLVAFSGITTGTAAAGAAGDAADDQILQDRAIVILTQPSNFVGVATTTATFSVTAISNPPGDASLLTYQWQFNTGSGSYTNLSNGGNISGVTSSTVSIANTDAARNGYRYRVVISAPAARSVNSGYGILGITTI